MVLCAKECCELEGQLHQILDAPIFVRLCTKHISDIYFNAEFIAKIEVLRRMQAELNVTTTKTYDEKLTELQEQEQYIRDWLMCFINDV